MFCVLCGVQRCPTLLSDCSPDELPTPLHPRDSHSLSHSGILPRKCITDKSQRQLANSEIISKWFLPGEESVYEMLNAIYVPMNIKYLLSVVNVSNHSKGKSTNWKYYRDQLSYVVFPLQILAGTYSSILSEYVNV